MSNPFDKIHLVIGEIIHTEETYNKGLQTAIEEIINPLVNAIEGHHIFIENMGVMSLFTKFKGVKAVAQTFLTTMNNYMVEGSNQEISDVFYQFPILVSDYFAYIQDYHVNGPAVRALRKNNLIFDQFIKEREANTRDTFESFLIMPVQRPPRYRLLLQELIKETPKTAPEYAKLNETLDNLCKAISTVDKRIAEFDEANQMAEIQSKFNMNEFSVLVKGRHLYFHGECTKFSRKKMDSRYIIIFSDCLVVAEPLLLLTSLKLNKIYNYGQYNILPVNDRPPFINAVDIRQQEKSFRINLMNANSKSEILEGFKKMLEFNNINQQDLENRGFAPVWIPDDQAPNCMVCNSKFTFVNRRHHCRYCGDCVCKNCWTHKIVCPGLGPSVQNVCDNCFKRITEMNRNRSGSRTKRSATLTDIPKQGLAESPPASPVSPNQPTTSHVKTPSLIDSPITIDQGAQVPRSNSEQTTADLAAQGATSPPKAPAVTQAPKQNIARALNDDELLTV